MHHKVEKQILNYAPITPLAFLGSKQHELKDMLLFIQRQHAIRLNTKRLKRRSSNFRVTHEHGDFRRRLTKERCKDENLKWDKNIQDRHKDIRLLFKQMLSNTLVSKNQTQVSLRPQIHLQNIYTMELIFRAAFT